MCLVDHADLIRSLYSWWEGLGPCSLPTLPLGFNCGFFFHLLFLYVGRLPGFAPEAVLEDLGLPQ